MPNPQSDIRAGARRSSAFPTTRWSLVVAAGAQPSGDARRALEDLCQQYWSPIYAYVRRRGYSLEDAQDLTQGFFCHLLSRNRIAQADNARGRFRSWLLTSLRRYLGDQRAQATALKRGGAVTLSRLDIEGVEARILGHTPPQWDAEREFDRNWAKALLEQVMGRLERDYQRMHKAKAFEALKASLSPQGACPSHESLAGTLGLTTGAVRQEIYRLRKSFRETLRREIAHTVERPEEVEGELRYLISVLS